MKTKLFLPGLFVILLIAFSSTVFPLTSPFTHQDNLTDATGSATSGASDFQFALYDTGETLIDLSSAQTTGIRMTNGIFTAQLDFCGNALAQEVKFL